MSVPTLHKTTYYVRHRGDLYELFIDPDTLVIKSILRFSDSSTRGTPMDFEHLPDEVVVDFGEQLNHKPK